jgi:RND family efflux transporter MFP subunit
MTTRPRLFSILVLIFACASQTGCDRDDQKRETKEKGANRPVVLVVPVQRGDLTEDLVYPVDIEAEVKVSINSLMSERIVKFPWENGDHIEKGQIVARVRADNAAQALAQMRAELESLDAQIANQKSERSRAKGLLDKEVITRQTYENLDAQVKVAEAKRKSVKAAISQTAISAGHAIIRAPISGVVANKRVNQGDLAAPQIPLCDIMTEDPVKVVLKIPEREIAHVGLEQTASIALDAYPGRTFRGAVAKILPYMDPATRTNEVEVLLPNPVHPTSHQRLLKPGMFGRATIVAKESRNALVVPERALLMSDDAAEGAMIAFVVDEGDIARKRSVRIGIRQGERVEVLSGLKEKEQLVVRGQHGLEDGEPVKRFENESNTEEKKGTRP